MCIVANLESGFYFTSRIRNGYWLKTTNSDKSISRSISSNIVNHLKSNIDSSTVVLCPCSIVLTSQEIND